MLASEQIGKGHHDEFVDIDSEALIYLANVLNSVLLPLHLTPLKEYPALSHAQFFDFGL